jgi:hypothetical protein
MASMRDDDVRRNEFGDDLGQDGREDGEQAGDMQGLSPIADAADESVEELADAGQDYEAGVVEGVEEAADNPERPVHTHENQGRSPDVPPVRGSE